MVLLAYGIYLSSKHHNAHRAQTITFISFSLKLILISQGRGLDKMQILR